MTHFAYPNASPTQGLFLGCGRYAASALDEPPGNGYELVQLNIPNIAQVSLAALILAPECGDTGQVIYEIRDETRQRFIGESLDLAYVLTLINRSRQLKLLINNDIWCTGCINMGYGVTPLLTTVDFAGFDIKLRAFLSEENEDRLFIVPAANIQPIHQVLFNDYGVRPLSLNQFVGIAVQDFFESKVILKVHLNELELLRNTIFNEPAKPASEEKIHEVWGYGVSSKNLISSFNGKEIEILIGDITKVRADAIVNCDDAHLSMRGGLPRDILEAGGKIIWDETRKYVPAKLGSALVTSAGRLQAKYLIHSIIGDFYKGILPDPHLVETAVINCLNEADRLKCKTVAMPVLNVEYVINAMTDTICEQLDKKANLQKVALVLYEQDTLFDYLKASFERKTFYV
jgi:O-acetyl-ADP-ribose deacetylase (regulator of RNase III)